jgi:hypothetical protein
MGAVSVNGPAGYCLVGNRAPKVAQQLFRWKRTGVFRLIRCEECPTRDCFQMQEADCPPSVFAECRFGTRRRDDRVAISRTKRAPNGSFKSIVVDLRGIEPLTSSMPRKRAPAAPQAQIRVLADFTRWPVGSPAGQKVRGLPDPPP